MARQVLLVKMTAIQKPILELVEAVVPQSSAQTLLNAHIVKFHIIVIQIAVMHLLPRESQVLSDIKGRMGACEMCQNFSHLMVIQEFGTKKVNL